MRSALRVCPQCGATATGLACPRDGWPTVPQELVDATHLPRGTLLLGRYVVGAFVEAHGVIALHEGHDSQTCRPVHISVVPLPTGAALADVGRVQRAAKELERLDHPNVAKVLATGMTERGDLAVVEDQVDAPTLAELVRMGPIGAERTITLGLSLVAGLEAAHAEALAHHDLAPTRVRVRPDGTGIMTGMGLGDLLRALDPLAEHRPANGAAALYRAPEQAHDRLVTRHADLYSLGAVLYEALTGTPYTGPGDVLAAGPAATDPSGWGATIERPIADVLRRCLERKPWNRYDSATSVREALETARDALQRPDADQGVDLAAIAWSPPTSEPLTRPRTRPSRTGDSGLLASVPARERDPFEQDARPSDEGPIAPIARPVVHHLPERVGGWWLVVALVGLIVTGLAMTRLRSADPSSRSASGAPAREAATTDVTRERAVAEAARQEAELQLQRTLQGEALAQQELDEQQLLEGEELARVELEETARRGTMERAQREGAALAQLELEERLWLEGEELARMDAEDRAREAAERARVEAEDRLREAQEIARIDAERRSREADVRARREADARIRDEIESTRGSAVPVTPISPPREATPARHDPTPTVSPGTEPPDPGDTASSFRRALLVTVPEGASVLVDGAPIGKTPLTLSWATGTESSVWVMLEGHEPANFVISDRRHAKMLRLELVESQR